MAFSADGLAAEVTVVAGEDDAEVDGSVAEQPTISTTVHIASPAREPILIATASASAIGTPLP
jgi:hypothetical protein